jgi:Spy/CpxP family protein refolding chaperone
MKQSWKIAIAFVVVFLAGGAIGSVLTLRFAKPPPPPALLAQPDNLNVHLMQRWMQFNQLNLTPAQREKIRPIIADGNEDVRRLLRENLHSEQLIIEHVQDEIAAILNPAQRNKFNDLIDSQRQKIEQFRQQQQRLMMQQQMQQDQAKP